MAEALISVLLEHLASAVFEHTKKAVTLVLKAEKDVQSLRSQLKVIQTVLEDAEKKHVTEFRVGDWLQKLKDVVYDEMDDDLDESTTEILKQVVEDKMLLLPKRRIKELNMKLSLIAVEKQMYDLHQSVVGHDEQQLIQRQKTTLILSIYLRHMVKKRKKIIAGSIYLLFAFNGMLVAALFVVKRPAVGSSGALYGLLGATVSALIQNWNLYANKVYQ